MPFISIPLKDAREQEAVPEGTYDLQIVKAEDKDSKKGNPMTAISIKIRSADYPNAMLVNHFLLHPHKGMEPDQVARSLRDTKRFLTVFGIPFEGDGFNTDDLQGATAECLLEQETGDDDVVRNRLRLPPLKDE